MLSRAAIRLLGEDHTGELYFTALFEGGIYRLERTGPPGTVGPFDAGPFIDLWTIHFTHDQ